MDSEFSNGKIKADTLEGLKMVKERAKVFSTTEKE